MSVDEDAAHDRRMTNGLRTRLRFCLGLGLILALASLGGCALCRPGAKVLLNPSFLAPQFPGPGDFVGAPVLQPRPATDGLQSTYSGTIFISMRDRVEVGKVLPFGFRLADQSTASSLHPVIFLVGDQREPSTLSNGTAIQICQDCGYQEMILLIPFVVRQGSSQWHNYAARMLLDDLTAVSGGNAIYGYAKEIATISRMDQAGATHYEISPWFAGVVFQAELERTGPWVPADQSSASTPRWNELKAIFQAAVLGQQPSDIPTPLVVICSYWEWDFTNAQVAPARTLHRIVRKFRNGMENWINASPIPNPVDGAVSVRGIRWRLATPPEGCQPG